MANFVLKALMVLGPEDILNLIQTTHLQQPLKKAAGEELVFWEDELPKDTKKEAGKVLELPKRAVKAKTSLEEAISKDEEVEKPQEDESGIQYSDIVLWQREIAKSAEAASHKVDAVKGYKKSTEMYVVKSVNEEGKEKIRFASTDGVLVNKKQA